MRRRWCRTGPRHRRRSRRLSGSARRTTSLASTFPDLRVQVSGCEQAQEFRFSVVVAFMCLGQRAPAPIQRTAFAGPVAQGVVLHPPVALVEFLVGQLHPM